MKQKTPEIGAQTRAQIAETLPQAIETAVLMYVSFMESNQNADTTKDYKDHVSAAKAGLAHIELLLKLAKMVEIVDDNRARKIIGQLHDAQAELDNNE